MGEERLEDKWLEMYYCGAGHKIKIYEGKLGDFSIPELEVSPGWLDDFNNFGRMTYHFTARARAGNNLFHELKLLAFLQELDRQGVKYRVEEGRYESLTSSSRGKYVMIVKEGD